MGSSSRNFGGGGSNLRSGQLLLAHDDQVDACGKAAELGERLHLQQQRYKHVHASGSRRPRLSRFKYSEHGVAGIGRNCKLVLRERAERLYVLGINRYDLQQGAGPP